MTTPDRDGFNYRDSANLARDRQPGDLDIVWAHFQSRIASRLVLWAFLSFSVWAAQLAGSMTGL